MVDGFCHFGVDSSASRPNDADCTAGQGRGSGSAVVDLLFNIKQSQSGTAKMFWSPWTRRKMWREVGLCNE